MRHVTAFIATIALSAMITLIPLSACDDDGGSSTPADTSSTQDTTDTADGVGGGDTDVTAATCEPQGLTITEPMDPDPACTEITDLEGTTLVVDYIKIDQPDNGLLLSTLNPLFENDMQTGDLILLFHIESYDPASGVALVKAGPGKTCDGIYQWQSTPDDITLQVTGCDFATEGSASIKLEPATVNKPIIVSALDVSGSYAADGSRILTADLVGAIKESDATGLIVTLGPGTTADLAELLHGFSIDLTADTDEDGTPDAWVLGGKIAAKAVTNVDLTVTP